MRLDILLRLADMLETQVEQERLDLNQWGWDRQCGFIGCAIGWGIHLGILDGLAFTESYRIIRSDGIRAPESYGRIGDGPYDRITDWRTVSAYLDITLEECRYLFNRESYEESYDSRDCPQFEPDQVGIEVIVGRIRDFVSSKQMEG